MFRKVLENIIRRENGQSDVKFSRFRSKIVFCGKCSHVNNFKDRSEYFQQKIKIECVHKTGISDFRNSKKEFAKLDCKQLS